MTFPPQQFIETAVAAADAARLVTAGYFRTGVEVSNKHDRSPVTVADREAEQRIMELIVARHPAHSFLGEETGATGSDEEWRWVIDPIDGTKSFATGNPTFGTLIALLHHGRPVIGIIDHGALDERWVGVKGRDTTHNDASCATSAVERLADGSLYTTTLDMFAGETLAQFNRLSGAFRFRVFGGDCYGYGLLSSGFTEAVCEAQMKPHDYMALVPVIEGAGGVITDWRGGRLTSASDGRVLAAANARLHQAALACLNLSG